MTQTEESKEAQSGPVPTENPVASLRDEFRKEFDTLKASFESELKALKTENESLKSQNTDLQRALIRSATVPETPAPVPKTEEQLYAEQIDALAKKTLERMCHQ